MNSASFNTWTEQLTYKANMLYRQIAHIRQSLESTGSSEAMIEQLTAPYIALLTSMYREDFPLAHAMEVSDLVLHIQGPAVESETPRISLIATLFGEIRTQVTKVAKAIAGVAEVRGIPREMDLRLTALAPGSLYLGFTLATPESEEEADGQGSLFSGEDDPIYRAAREAMRVIGTVTRYASGAEPSEEALQQAVPDPMIRDVAMTAVAKLAPTGRRGIESVEVSGKEFPTSGTYALTKDSRKELVATLKRPILVSNYESATFEGEIREIDLDLHRFELRRVKGEYLSSIRCKYGEELEGDAEKWPGKKVVVTGLVERDKDGRARLIEVQRIEYQASSLLPPPSIF